MIEFKNITSLFNVDFDALRNHVLYLENTLEKVGSSMFSGWAVTGSTGKHTDGWIDGSKFFKKNQDGKMIWDAESAKKLGFAPNKMHINYTNAASDDLIKFIESTKQFGLNPCRARLIQLVPGAQSSWHTDGFPGKLVLRLHVVIKSNPDAIFKTEQGETHLPENNIFLINVNYHHMVINRGLHNRTHLVMDVTDDLNLFGT